MTTNHWPRRIGSALGAVLLCACVALFVGVTVLPRVFGIELRTVVSGSMEPAIDKGSLVVASPASVADLRVGDVIMFAAPDGSGRVITHRVAGLHDDTDGRTIETRGDANNANDPWTVTAHELKGKVRGDIPRAGYVVEKVRSRTGFLLLMVLPALIVVAGEASVWRRFFRGRRQVEAAAVAPVRTALGPNPYLYPVTQTPPEAHRRPSAFLLGAGVMTLAVAAVAGAMFVIAPRPSSPDNEARVAGEAVSIARHSGSLADGEAFDGDIQILRDADDARLRDPATLPDDRLTALRQMLLLNTNRFDALTLADLRGVALASTDSAFGSVADSMAYAQAVATDGVAASDITTSADGTMLLDYAAPVRDAAGRTQAILVGRTTPARLWATTLAASIDGGRNLLLDANGSFIAGTGDGEAGARSGLAAGDAAQRLTVGATPSICALSPIGRDTHLDHGWSVAACLPQSLAAPATTFPALQFVVNAIAVVLVTFSAALLLLAWLLGERGHDDRKAAAPSGLKAIEARLLAQREGPGPR